MKIDLTKFTPYLNDKLISCQQHPDFPLLIFNYTQNAQFSGKWDEVTRMCRGLITDREGNVIARPFDKFFNRGEQGEPHAGSFVAYDKMDGSLGILYPWKGKLYIATRGSFISEQAKMGTELLERYFSVKAVKDILLNAAKSDTLMFEIIYPENRIVVDYKGFEGLIYLASRNIETGEISQKHQLLFNHALEITDHEKPRDNAEGVVLYYADGFLEKVKYEEYVRLHRLVTGVTARRIWDLLRHGQTIDELIDRVPEEFKDWVIKTRDTIKYAYETVEQGVVVDLLDSIKDLPTRKEQAIKLMKNKKWARYVPIVFKVLDKQPYDQIIWKLLKPAAEKPYREDM